MRKWKQNTGFEDMNGEKIFVGDKIRVEYYIPILFHHGSFEGIVEIKDDEFIVKTNNIQPSLKSCSYEKMYKIREY